MELSIPWNTNMPPAMYKVRGCFEAITIIPVVIAIIFIAFWIVGFTKHSIEQMETLNLIVGLTLALAAIALLMWMFLTRKKRKNTNIMIDDQHVTISLPVLTRNDDGKTLLSITS